VASRQTRELAMAHLYFPACVRGGYARCSFSSSGSARATAPVPGRGRGRRRAGLPEKSSGSDPAGSDCGESAGRLEFERTTRMMKRHNIHVAMTTTANSKRSLQMAEPSALCDHSSSRLEARCGCTPPDIFFKLFHLRELRWTSKAIFFFQKDLRPSYFISKT